MKKISRVFMVVVLLLIGLTLTGCKNKTAISSNDFESKMKAKDFIVSNATNQFEGTEGIINVILAAPQDKSFQIEFYEVSTVEQAVSSYNLNKSNFELVKASSSSYNEVNVANYSKYTLNSNGKFMVVSRIENTFIYINVEQQYKDTVNKILNELGY